MVVQILRVACNEGEGTSTHSCQRKSLLAVCAYKVTAHFQRPLNEWQGGEGKFTPATTAMHNDRLSGCRGHSCCLEITYRSTLLLWRMRFPGGLSTGWKQEELFRRGTKTANPGLWQETRAEDWVRTGLPGVAAWMGEPPVRDPEVVQLWSETRWGSGMTLPAAGLEVLLSRSWGGGWSLKGSATSCIYSHFLLLISSLVYYSEIVTNAVIWTPM